MVAELRFAFPKWFWLVLGCMVVAVLGVKLLPLYKSRPSPQGQSIQNIKQLGLSLVIYSTDYDDLMPRSVDWSVVTMPYRKNNDVMNDPMRGFGLKYGYAFYRPLEEQDMTLCDNLEEIPLFFQTDRISFNASGDLSILPKSPRAAGGKDIYAHPDGSAKVRPRAWAATFVLKKRKP